MRCVPCLLIFTTLLGFYRQICVGILTGSKSLTPWEFDSSKVEDHNEPKVSANGLAEFLSLTSTGTTIVGLTFKHGVVLGADTRSTGGSLVMDKEKLKIHTIARHIFCCAAGTSADCDQITRRAGHELALSRLERELCGEESSLDPITAALKSVVNSLEHASKGGRMPSSVMILGGIDDGGPALYIVDESKVPQRVNFAALGSGSADAIALLENSKRQWQRGTTPAVLSTRKGLVESRFTEDIDVSTAVDAVRDAVRAGIMNDLGSGGHIDFCVIQNSDVLQWREAVIDVTNENTLPNLREGAVNDVCNRTTINITVSAVRSEVQANASLGDMIFSRSKLLRYLEGTAKDEKFLVVTESCELPRAQSEYCDVQMV